MAMKPLPLILLIILLVAIAAGAWFALSRPAMAPADIIDPATVLSFADCEAAGYPVMESHPRRCMTPDGRTYAEELPAPEPTYVNASADHIRVTTPTPGAVVGRTFEIRGEARGPWFFEASFPIQVLAEDGSVLTTVIGQPVGGADWMVEDFLPFSASVSLPETYSGPATLLFVRDNPSGLPEHDRSMAFPITVSF